ncbi:MAG TPA: hypothetical protein VK960_06670 [Acidimicrobiia bacterium]|nr:hypothetical protein [Acidimicrobiia bacterium]
MRRLLLIAIAVFIVPACGDDDATTTTGADTPSTTASVTTLPPVPSTSNPATTTTADSFVDIVIEVIGSSAEVRVEGIPTSGRIQITTGTGIRLTIAGDATDEVHLHGYDLTADIAPGQPAVIEFAANIPGIFEVELEDSHRLLVELQVS